MKLILALFLGFLTLAGCSDRVIPPVDTDGPIAFELVYPHPTSADSYFGVSGVRLVTDEVVRDTIVRVTGRSFFAQFFTSGPALPGEVALNGVPFVRHAKTDTLRLGSTDNSSLLGLQSWRITDVEGTATYQVQPLSEIDSVTPLMAHEPIRGDTALVLRWRTPSTSTGGVLLTWRMSGVETHSQTVPDNGRLTIPSSIVSRFAGESELILSRYRHETVTHRGRPLVLTRVAQRNYKVTVL